MLVSIFANIDQNYQVNYGEDNMVELRQLAVTDPHRIIWSNTAETIEVQKIDNRLGCKIVARKV